MDLQRTDPYLGDILTKLEDQIPPYQKQKKNNLKNYHIQDDTLYRNKILRGQSFYKICVPLALKYKILEAFHGDLMAGHLGSFRTVHKIRKRFYWPKLEQDVRLFVRECLCCQMRKSIPDKPAGLIMFIEVEWWFQRVGIDLLRPFPETVKGNKYIIVALDYLTKSTETAAFPTETVVDIAQFFVNHITLRHGSPHSIISDRGKGFNSGLMRDTLEANTRRTKTTARHLVEMRGKKQ